MQPSVPALQQARQQEEPVQVPTARAFDNSSQSSTASHISNIALPAFPEYETGSVDTPTASHDLTPPSSAASPNQGDRKTSPDSPTPKKNALDSGKISSIPSESTPIHTAIRGRSDSAAGSKRTASGHVKQPRLSHTSRTEHRDANHTRSPSTASVGSTGNVAEISQQLRTKLKYAMVKVQHGWQTRSLDELESLASASPRSTVSNFPHTDHNVSDSPKRIMQQRLSRKWSDSSSSASSHSDIHSMQSPRLSAVPEFIPRKGGLAPPADIVAGQRRRPSPNEQTGKAHDLQRTVRPMAKQRTPSQNAVLEKDAVETLLFMASPNNSSYHVNSQLSQESTLRSMQPISALTSPLRTQFSQTSVTSPKKVTFTDQNGIYCREDRSAAIDRLLDEPPDASDEDDDLHDAGPWPKEGTGSLLT